MANVLREGEPLVLVGGRYENVYVTGLFRATRDLDLDALQAEFVAEGPEVTDRETFEEHPLRAVFGTPSGSVGLGAPAANFQSWLIERGDLERMPHKTVAFDIAWGPKKLPYPGSGKDGDGWVFDNQVSEVLVDEPALVRTP